jgi:putative FmdB family regulatory protein
MPAYEYKCPACGFEFEVERSIKDESDQDCPACDHEVCERLISLSAFHLKGGGWFGGAGCKTPASEVDKNWLSHFSTHAIERKK